MKHGDWVVYDNGYKREIGRVTSITSDGESYRQRGVRKMKLKLHQIIIAVLLPIIGSIESVDWSWF